MELAQSMASRNRAKCHVVHIWDLEYKGAIDNPFLNLHAEDIAPDLRREKKDHADKFNAFLKAEGVDTTEVKAELIEGEPSLALTEYVEANDIDLIVIGTVQRVGISELLMGHTAEELLGQVNCEILAVKPGRSITK